MKARVTQADIARLAGVHNTTVSLALRNDPLIHDATRDRIHAIAQQLGYTPDAAGRALASYRSPGDGDSRQIRLALVTGEETSGAEDARRVHDGVLRRAAEFGVIAETFRVDSSAAAWSALDATLRQRSIRLVVLATAAPDDDAAEQVDWSRLCAVSLGESCAGVPLHRVEHNAAGIVREAQRQAEAAGRRRIGIVVPPAWPWRAHERWLAAVHAAPFRSPPERRIPVLDQTLFTSDDGESDLSPTQQLTAWVEQHRPDVVVGFGKATCRQLQLAGYAVPGDLAYINLCLDGDDDIAGVRLNSERVGGLAVELIVSQFHRNECGQPTTASTTVVDGTWIPGATLAQPSTVEPAWTAPLAQDSIPT
jgi:LacI family transcriptional regulator